VVKWLSITHHNHLRLEENVMNT